MSAMNLSRMRSTLPPRRAGRSATDEHSSLHQCPTLHSLRSWSTSHKQCPSFSCAASFSLPTILSSQGHTFGCSAMFDFACAAGLLSALGHVVGLTSRDQKLSSGLMSGCSWSMVALQVRGMQTDEESTSLPLRLASPRGQSCCAATPKWASPFNSGLSPSTGRRVSLGSWGSHGLSHAPRFF